MATTFDGVNLIITLDPVVDGVLTVNIIDDIYEPWKDWVKTGDNAKYIPAFRSDGGNPLTDTINQGSYIFQNNEEGWRIKPAENDGTYFFIGNLAAENTALPLLAPTDGNFSVLINGLQAITQGVDPLADQMTRIETGVITSRKILQNRTETNPVTGIMTVYDDDDSVLFTANIWENIAGTEPYDGDAVNRRNRLA